MSEDRVTQFWAEFVAARAIEAPFTAWHFGADDDPKMQTELAALVVEGPKRATAGVLAEYEAENESLPQVGDYSVILDGAGDPMCIILTTSIEIRAFGEVDEDFAWTEGEGDRTLEWWRRAHSEFFASVGVTINEDTQMILERFDLVWPA